MGRRTRSSRRRLQQTARAAIELVTSREFRWLCYRCWLSNSLHAVSYCQLLMHSTRPGTYKHAHFCMLTVCTRESATSLLPASLLSATSLKTSSFLSRYKHSHIHGMH